MRLADFDYYLPDARIAQTPVEPRDHSKLMVVAPSGDIIHKRFYELPEFVTANDVLVINETRVIPARLHGTLIGTASKIEFLLLRPLTDTQWEVLVKPGRRAKVGAQVDFGGRIKAEILSTTDVGGRVVEFSFDGRFEDVLNLLGEMPLPPYITEKLVDKERYQTVYSKEQGSVAAPTAGLHFTERLMDELIASGVTVVPLTLHVGIGTFRPVKVEDISQHQMHAEYYCLSEAGAKSINAVKASGGRVIAVGTTTVRVLETLATKERCIVPGSGWTDIFITPGYRYKLVDMLITNYHLPKSSLLMLVSAFAGYDQIMQAYQEALIHKYRFYSFGDAMLLYCNQAAVSCEHKE